jgi:hypothetical protein
MGSKSTTLTPLIAEDHGRKIQTTSFTSIGRYLKEFGLMEEAVVYEGEEVNKLF